MRTSKSQRAVWLACTALIGALYFWVIGIGADSQRFCWSTNLNGYYDLLGRGFASGKLYLPIDPKPELLALPDPYDERAIAPYGLLDAVLYNRRYYLYHGAAPAVTLFAPYRLLTRHDLPENFAAFLFAFGAYLFLSVLLAQILSISPARAPKWLLALMLLTLGAGGCVPFVLHRVKVYEVAILSGVFYLSGGFYLFFRQLTAAGGRVLWSGLAGLSFGLAIGSRPHMAVAAAAGLLVLLLRRDRLVSLFAFAAPVVACGAAIAVYNHARFGNPLEFGLNYQLGYGSYRNFHLSSINLPAGLYYLLICPPDWVPEFPFLRLTLRQPFGSPVNLLPPRYFLEPIAGIFCLSPLAIFGLLAPAWIKRSTKPVSGLLLVMLAYCIGCILAIAATGLTSQRFEADFQPFLLFIACVLITQLLGSLKSWPRVAASAVVTILMLYGLAANLALAVQGPYDQFVQASPQTYVRLARWFSPVQRFRPLLNPHVRAQVLFDFSAPCPWRRPLIVAGEFGSRYRLAAECGSDGKIRLFSETSVAAQDERAVEVFLSTRQMQVVAIEFTPGDRTMRINWNGTLVLEHQLRFLVTAPSQIHFGWDPTFGSTETFPGRIVVRQPPEVIPSG